jgi:hypothetical protein
MVTRPSQVLIGGIACAALVALLPSSASAQTHSRFEFAPAFGAYLPTHRLPAGPGNDFTPYAGGCPVIKPDPPPACLPMVYEHQTSSVAVGGRLTAWFSKRGALEGSFYWVPSAVAGVFDGPAHLLVGGVNLVANVAPRRSRASLLLSGGPVVIHRAGEAYVNVRGTTSPGGMLGIGVDVRTVGVGLRAQLGDYLSWAKFASANRPLEVCASGCSTLTAASDWQFQQDVMLSVSVTR